MYLKLELLQPVKYYGTTLPQWMHWAPSPGYLASKCLFNLLYHENLHGIRAPAIPLSHLGSRSLKRFPRNRRRVFPARWLGESHSECTSPRHRNEFPISDFQFSLWWKLEILLMFVEYSNISRIHRNILLLFGFDQKHFVAFQ